MGEAAAKSGDSSGNGEEFTSRLFGSMNRLAEHARGSARRVKHAAKDLRTSPAMQHAAAARERGNLEAAFWLLDEEFTRNPDDPEVALPYWDVALSLGRVDIARKAGVKLVEARAAAGEPELAAQHWLELIKEAPDVLVSPTAIATILPALKARLESSPDEGADDAHSLASCLRRAVRNAVDPRNTGLHPGVALRIFEEGREINPEAARRAAEAALESPNLHEAKRERLVGWLCGDPEPSEKPAPQRASRRPAPTQPPAETPSQDPPQSALSPDEIQAAAERLSRKEARPTTQPEPSAAAQVHADAAEPEPNGSVQQAPEKTVEAEEQAEAAETVETVETVPSEAPEAPELPEVPVAAIEPEEAPPTGAGPRIAAGTLEGLEEDALVVGGAPDGRLAYDEIQAVSVAEIMGLEEEAVRVVDLIRNWAGRKEERLDIIRLRVDDLDLAKLVTRKHALCSDFAALMGEIMERTSAIPLPDPDSALGNRISCFGSPELYEQLALRAGIPGA
jgi:hypothetical protein